MSNCIIWDKFIDGQGYGRKYYTIDGKQKQKQAHRWVYEQHHNKVLPRDICVCHICDNPSCVNPEHLFEGTHKDNMRDKHQKGRCVGSPGKSNGNSKLTEKDVLNIRKKEHSVDEYAKIYNVCTAHIHAIWNRKYWGWL